jgi:hypothetical protein
VAHGGTVTPNLENGLSGSKQVGWKPPGVL